MDIVEYGKKYRRPTKEEREENFNNLLYDFGTHASIILNHHNKYEYLIYYNNTDCCDNSRYNYFDTVEQAKEYLIKTHGGKWKWSKKYIK